MTETGIVPLTLPVEQFTQTRYRCPYCRRSWVSEKRATGHRDACWYNRGCKSCRHAGLIGGSYVQGCDLGEDLYQVDPESSYGEGRVVPRANCPLWEEVA